MPTGLTFTAFLEDDSEYASTFYSIGGGFVVKEERANAKKKLEIKCAFPFPIQNAAELLSYTVSENKIISEIVYENEKAMRSEETIHHELMRIWDTMLECMYIGCHSEGILPGGLNVHRRAFRHAPEPHRTRELFESAGMARTNQKDRSQIPTNLKMGKLLCPCSQRSQCCSRKGRYCTNQRKRRRNPCRVDVLPVH